MLDRLYATCLYLEQDGERLLWIHADVLGLERDFVLDFWQWAKQRWGLDTRQVMISATHTHSGPVTIHLQEVGAYDPKYVAFLRAQMEPVVEAAVGQIEPCEIAMAEGKLGLAVDRRRKATPHTDPRVESHRWPQPDAPRYPQRPPRRPGPAGADGGRGGPLVAGNVAVSSVPAPPRTGTRMGTRAAGTATTTTNATTKVGGAMRAITLLAAVVVAGSAGLAGAAEALPLPDRVLFYDPTYSVVYAGQMAPAVDYFTAQGFAVLDTKALLAWIKVRVEGGNAAGTAVLQISDVVPTPLVEPWDKTCALYRYCAAGGRYIAAGGSPLYSFEGEHDFTISDQGADTPDGKRLLTHVFGVNFVYALKGKGRKLTPAGTAWGLDDGAWLNSLQTGVPPADVTLAFAQSEDGTAALAWLKNVNPAEPSSGLVGLCSYICASQPLLEALYRLCVYAGTPVKDVPKVDWHKLAPEPEIGVRVSMRYGRLERRAFQRGEKIPLRIAVHGTTYTGQAVGVEVRGPDGVVWEKSYPRGGATGLCVNEDLETRALRCGEYQLACSVAGAPASTETFWVCAARRQNPFPWFLCKMHRKNPSRERLALGYARANYLNVNLYDLYQFEKITPGTEPAGALGRYLDLMLRDNLMCALPPGAMPLYAERDDEMLLLANGKPLSHGVQPAISWRGIVDGHLTPYRDSLRRQVELLREARSPAVVPFFFTNDDGSMPGSYDFNPVTLAAFEKQSGLKREALPPMQQVSPNIFMPEVAPGVIADDHPWLRYYRWLAAQYALISQTAMEGIEAGWPGSLVSDMGCMSGPLYGARAFYPPLSHSTLNTAGFYQYDFWSYSYGFSIEAARMGNREKPVAVTLSASYIPWGAVFQRSMIYEVLAQAPAYMGFWSLEARRRDRWDLEEESYSEIRRIGERLASVADLLTQSQVRRRQGALFVGLAQLCFRAKDRHFQNHDLRAAYENLRRAGAELDLVCSEELASGRAAQYRVIFLNGVQWVTQGDKDALEAYIRNGGVVVADSGTTVPIEGALRAAGPFGSSFDDAHGLQDAGEPANVALCRTYVEAHIEPDLVTTPTPETVIHVNQAGATPLVWVLDVLNRDAMLASRQARIDDWDRGVRNHLVRLEAATPTVRKTLRLREGYWAYDVWAHQELALRPAGAGRNQGEVTTEFYGGTPVCLYRDRIDDLCAVRPARQIQRGDTAHFAFELRSARGTPVRGWVPAEFRVTYPDGTEAWEYGGSRLIKDGALQIALSPALNDVRGPWRLSVRELCSGRRAEVGFKVE